MTANFTIRDEIREYWSERAETFDLQPGHEIFSEQERDAWHQLITTMLGPGNNRTALDLACGTGVISHLLDDCGYNTTGMDWSEVMLNKAREKSLKRRSQIRFLMGDAEKTLEPHNSYDVIVTRHLVWTLVDPLATFSHWYNTLKPGGHVLIVDGDFVSSTLMDKLSRLVETIKFKLRLSAPDTEKLRLQKTHARILEQVYFKHGARSDAVVALLDKTGFKNIVVQSDLSDIHKAQGKHLPLLGSIARQNQHRYAITAVKP